MVGTAPVPTRQQPGVPWCRTATGQVDTRRQDIACYLSAKICHVFVSMIFYRVKLSLAQ
jgi:hypothetical protein